MQRAQVLKGKLVDSVKGRSSGSRHFEVPRTGTNAGKKSELSRYVTTGESLATFLRKFVMNIDAMLTMINSLLDIARSLEPTGQEDGSESSKSVKMHVWAVAMGIKATAPGVSKQLQRYLKRLEQAVVSAKACQVHLDSRSELQEERNHYLLKVQVLLQEQEERGRSTSEQQGRLKRNQVKLMEAEKKLSDQELMGADVSHDIRDQLQQALSGISQTVACGWLMSTGAVVCKALQQAYAAAEEAQAEEKAQAEEGDDHSCDLAPPVSSGPPRILALPPSIAAERFEPPSAYDPEDPFGVATEMPETSGLRPSVVPVAPKEFAGSDPIYSNGRMDSQNTTVPPTNGANPDITSSAFLEYLVDNSVLSAPTVGLGYRQTEVLGDTRGDSNAPWGSIVRGTVTNDNWLRVGEYYLPFRIQGKLVLRCSPMSQTSDALPESLSSSSSKTATLASPEASASSRVAVEVEPRCSGMTTNPAPSSPVFLSGVSTTNLAPTSVGPAVLAPTSAASPTLAAAEAWAWTEDSTSPASGVGDRQPQAANTQPIANPTDGVAERLSAASATTPKKSPWLEAAEIWPDICGASPISRAVEGRSTVAGSRNGSPTGGDAGDPWSGLGDWGGFSADNLAEAAATFASVATAPPHFASSPTSSVASPVVGASPFVSSAASASPVHTPLNIHLASPPHAAATAFSMASPSPAVATAFSAPASAMPSPTWGAAEASSDSNFMDMLGLYSVSGAPSALPSWGPPNDARTFSGTGASASNVGAWAAGSDFCFSTTTSTGSSSGSAQGRQKSAPLPGENSVAGRVADAPNTHRHRSRKRDSQKCRAPSGERRSAARAPSGDLGAARPPSGERQASEVTRSHRL